MRATRHHRLPGLEHPEAPECAIAARIRRRSADASRSPSGSEPSLFSRGDFKWAQPGLTSPPSLSPRQSGSCFARAGLIHASALGYRTAQDGPKRNSARGDRLAAFGPRLYARVSTEDRQSPADSIAWQRSIAAALIETSRRAHRRRVPRRRGFTIIAVVAPPRGRTLLADCARRDRGFDAIVIGEPQRAFAGSQYGLTAPLLWHHGVELWVPEVGGRVDPDSEAHDLVMSLFGGLSKAERARIQRRVRNAMQTMARAGGRYLGGRPPYGYRLVPVSPHPNAEKARMGATLNRLEPDPTTAPVVRSDLSETARRRRLLRNRPPAQHRRHPLALTTRPRCATRIATGPDGPTRPSVRSCATPATPATKSSDGNDATTSSSTSPPPPKATFAACAGTIPRPWIWSPEPTHEALVSIGMTGHERKLRPRTVKQRAPKPSSRPYLLRGRVFCASADAYARPNPRRRRRYYRCAAQARYPGITDAHPRDVLVREQPILDALDEWLDELFAPEHATETAQADRHRARPRPRPNRTHRGCPATHHRREARNSNAAEQPYRDTTRQPHAARSSAGSTRRQPRRNRPSSPSRPP